MSGWLFVWFIELFFFFIRIVLEVVSSDKFEVYVALVALFFASINDAISY